MGREGIKQLLDQVEAADVVAVGVPTMLEATMVLTARTGRDARPLLFGFLREIEAEIVPFQLEHYDAATTAFLRFGRGRHSAGLNFGDCMSYAVASVAELPLLLTGEDFGRTDIGQA
jgi:ribonuclease VapC